MRVWPQIAWKLANNYAFTNTERMVWRIKEGNLRKRGYRYYFDVGLWIRGGFNERGLQCF